VNSIVGVDIGVRHIAIARITNGDLYTKFYETPKTHRWDELNNLRDALEDYVEPGDTLWVEEPPLAGSRNVRILIQLNQTAGALMITSAPAYFVPVSSWKKLIIGKGNSSKEEVSEFLQSKFSRFFKQCKGNQNLVDATCIALYGCEMQ
jgi:Holliday junction resolvasome RuvABC endonuclease subunit